MSTARCKRKLPRKKKLKKKKSDSAGQTDEEDFCEDESVLFKEKYFNNIPWMCTGCEDVSVLYF